jgi:hypothetical protein
VCAFKISGPGIYLDRKGNHVAIKKHSPSQPNNPRSACYTFEGNDGYYRTERGFVFLEKEHDCDIVGEFKEVRAPKRKRKDTTKRRTTPMSKTTPKYFIGKLDKVKRGSPFRIFRRRTSRLGLRVDEVCMKEGWKRMKKGYKKVGEFHGSQAHIRADKKWWDRNGDR